MDEQTNLGFILRARILPHIEGSDELKQSVENLAQNIQERMQQTTSSPAFREGMKPEEIRKVEHFAGMTDMAEVQDFQKQQSEILEELDIDATTGKITLPQRRKYMKKFQAQKQELEKLRDTLLEQLDEKNYRSQEEIYKEEISSGASHKEALKKAQDAGQESQQFGFLTPDQREVFRKSIIQGTEESIENVDKLAERFGVVADNIEKSRENAKGLYDQLKEAGLFALTTTALNMGINYVTRTAGIEARERTSFDFGSPIGMYSTRRQYETFKETEERLRDYEMFGGIAGFGGGALGGALLGGKIGVAGGPVGAAAGMIAGGIGGALFGSSIGGKLANIENIEDRAELEEELKFLNQGWSQLSNYVNQAQQFDILRTRTRARLKENFEDVGLGYTPAQSAQYQMEFGDTFGKYDSQLYKEQMTFARAEGIDPKDLFRLNLTARMTGMDTSILGLREADRMAQITYGEGFGSQRIVDILNEIKGINERMLKVNLDMDTRDALGMSKIPSLMFGTDTPYGRLGELGGQSIRTLEGLMQPKSMAHEAFLYTSLGTPDIKEFTETMKGGIYGNDNLVKILKRIRETTGGSDHLSYFMLNEMMPDAPKGFIPRISELLTDEGKEITRYKVEGIDEEGNINYATDKEGNRIKETVSGYTLDDFEKEIEDYNEQIRNLKLTAREETEAREKINNALTGYEEKADSAISKSEEMVRTLHVKMNEAAESWRDMVYNSEIEMSKFWSRQAEDSEMFELFQVKINEGMEDFLRIIERIKGNLGLVDLPEGFSTAPKIAPNPFKPMDPAPEDLQKMDREQWIDYQNDINQATRMLPSQDFQNFFKDFDYERLEEIMSRTYQNSPREITVIVKDETDRGIDSTIEDANSEFR